MANSSLLLTHTHICWMKAVCSPFIQIHFALILQFEYKCNNSVSTSMAPSKSITQTHCVLDKWLAWVTPDIYVDTHTLMEWRQAGSSVLGQYWTQTLSTLTMSLYKMYSLCICVGMYTRTIRSVLVYLSSGSVFPSHRWY